MLLNHANHDVRVPIQKHFFPQYLLHLLILKCRSKYFYVVSTIKIQTANLNRSCHIVICINFISHRKEEKKVFKIKT